MVLPMKALEGLLVGILIVAGILLVVLLIVILIWNTYTVPSMQRLRSKGERNRVYASMRPYGLPSSLHDMVKSGVWPDAPVWIGRYFFVVASVDGLQIVSRKETVYSWRWADIQSVDAADFADYNRNSTGLRLVMSSDVRRILYITLMKERKAMPARYRMTELVDVAVDIDRMRIAAMGRT